MNTHQTLKKLQLDAKASDGKTDDATTNELNIGDTKASDASKYNLRCNRNISEKMTKKDFVYNIYPLVQSFRKVSEQRALGFQCNFCHERIATLLSLSTHVKFHCRRYCKICYWVLQQDETMQQHVERSHRIRPGITMNLY